MLDAFGGRKPPADELLVVTGSVIEMHPVTRVTAETVEAGGMAFPRESLRELVRTSGGRAWIAHADLPARVEAERVYQLRHNAMLHALFEDAESSVSRVPWQIWALLGLSVALLGWSAIRGG